MGKRIKVYVAGCYSADNVISVLNNMRIGMRKATEIMLAGYVPFVPWFDYHFQLNLREGEELKVEDYYAYCVEWLKVSDVLFLLPGAENSKGTKEELRVASLYGIPVVESIDAIKGAIDNGGD